jgi:hypothetical protein
VASGFIGYHEFMFRFRTLGSLGILAMALAPLAVSAERVEAQQIELGATPPPGPVRPEIVPPPGFEEITRPRESDFYPEDIRVRLDPAFILPLATVKQTGPNSAVQFGFSGWTSPQTPVGQTPSARRENPGWFALGFSFVWDVPVKPSNQPPRTP